MNNRLLAYLAAILLVCPITLQAQSSPKISGDIVTGMPTIEITSANLESYRAIIPEELTSFVKRDTVAISFIPESEAQKVAKSTKSRVRDLERFVEDGVTNTSRLGLGDERYAITSELSVHRTKFVESLKEPLKGLLTSQWKISREVFSPRFPPKIFFEVITPLAPNALDGFNFFTTRYLDSAREDDVEEFSPIIKSKRRLTEANRDDLILASGLSLNDFFLMGQNFSRLKFSEFSLQEILLPRVLETDQKEVSEGCSSLRDQGIETKESALENKLKLKLELRRAVRVYFHSEQTFSPYPSGVLYFDEEVKMPIFAVFFDQSARLAKFSTFYLTGVKEQNFYGEKNKPIIDFYPVSSEVIDIKNNSRARLQYKNYKVCLADDSE